MDPDDVAAVLAMKEAKPSTVGALRKLLGVISYYHQYIKDFSRLAKPLYDLLSCSDVPEQPVPRREERPNILEDKYP